VSLHHRSAGSSSDFVTVTRRSRLACQALELAALTFRACVGSRRTIGDEEGLPSRGPPESGMRRSSLTAASSAARQPAPARATARGPVTPHVPGWRGLGWRVERACARGCAGTSGVCRCGRAGVDAVGFEEATILAAGDVEQGTDYTSARTGWMPPRAAGPPPP